MIDPDLQAAGRGPRWVTVVPGFIRTEKGGLESTSESKPETGAETKGRRHAGAGTTSPDLPSKKTLPLILSSESNGERESGGPRPASTTGVLHVSEQKERKRNLLSNCPG